MNNLYISRTEKTIDCWKTPDYFFKLLDNKYHFTLDAAASRKNAKCNNFYTREDNGLIQDWKGETVFVNPPFSDIEKWTKKCFEEGQKEKTTVVMLCPPRIDTKYWHEYIMRAHKVCFCKGRVHFLRNDGDTKSSCTFGTCVIIFKKHSHKWAKLRPFHHNEKDLIKFRTIDDFCRSSCEEVRERPPLRKTNGGNRQK